MREISATDVIRETAASLGIVGAQEITVLLKPALRRAAFVLAPASRPDLIRFVETPLAPFGHVRDAIEAALDELVTYGDLLEMNRMSDDPWDASRYVLRPAPPSFVRRPGGDFIILGVAGDHATALTAELEARVSTDGPVRTLRGLMDEDLPTHLRVLGLAQLSEQAWLRLPMAETAAAHYERWRQALMQLTARTSNIEGLEVLDCTKSVRFYRGRWTVPGIPHTGIYIARRPQLYGAALWCLVELERGEPLRVLDLNTDDDRQRACDLAWRIQAAIDAGRSEPQCFRVRRGVTTSFIDFFSPLPAFAERRLALVAAKVTAPHCLYSFELPTERLSLEVAALETHLWMSLIRDEAH
jgi:hypothetical protein